MQRLIGRLSRHVLLFLIQALLSTTWLVGQPVVARQGESVPEEAQYKRARLLLAAGDFPGSAQAAEEGLRVAPNSAPLSLIKAEAEQKQGLWYQARRTLEQATRTVRDEALLRRAAEVEDTFGPSAAKAYADWAEFLEETRPHAAEYSLVLERGLMVTLREGQTDQAEWFADRLRRAGRPEFVSWLGRSVPDRARGIWIPGGLHALMYVARGKEDVAPSQFLVEYARAILPYIEAANKEVSKSYVERLSRYLRDVQALERFGKRTGDRVTVSLVANNEASRATTEAVLKLLGWELLSRKGQPVVEAAEGESAAERQLTASALRVDQVEMQRALQAGRTFVIELTDGWAPVLLDESAVRGALFPERWPAGGLPEALIRLPALARLCIALHVMDERSLSALLAGISLEMLVLRYADLLYLCSSALMVSDNTVVVPGAAAAEPIWQQLVGASPAQPPLFFRALLEKDDGKALVFFHLLAQLRPMHQRYFTQSASRLKQFYELFRDSPDVQHGIPSRWRVAPFVDFLAVTPLDAEGHVKLPGSPRVWMLAKGQSTSAAQTARLLDRLSEENLASADDQVLFRLAGTRYNVNLRPALELENYVAVVQLDAHRRQPLDERSALLLAQQYVRFVNAWPHFADLTGLGYEEFERFFALLENLAGYDRVALNQRMGQIYSLIELLCLAAQSGKLDEEESTAIFGRLCERFAAARSRADITEASLDTAREILDRSTRGAPQVDPDEAVRWLLLDPPSPVAFELAGVNIKVDAGKERREDYKRVLELQRVTPLSALFAMHDACRNLAAGRGTAAEQIEILEKNGSKLLAVPVPDSFKVSGLEKKNLTIFRPEEVAATIRALGLSLRQGAGKKVSELTRDLMALINPQVTVALAGIVYAYYLRSYDLLVSEDPLFLRKHQYIKLNSPFEDPKPLAAPDLEKGGAAGTILTGCFAGFSTVAGMVAETGVRSADEYSGAFVVHQLGAIRATRWGKLKDDDLRLVGLRVRAAREWIVLSADSAEPRAQLADATIGILSLARRSDLLAALDRRDWKSVWSSVTVGDLISLADEYLERFKLDPHPSPVFSALRLCVAVNDGSRLHWLGPTLGPLNNCSHPHLMRLAPYEHFEGFLQPARIAARSSEFNLYLAEFFDRNGLPANLMAEVAEPLALQLFRGLRIMDPRDWYSVEAAFSRLDATMLQDAMPGAYQPER
jgi:hypothetical protein